MPLPSVLWGFWQPAWHGTAGSTGPINVQASLSTTPTMLIQFQWGWIAARENGFLRWICLCGSWSWAMSSQRSGLKCQNTEGSKVTNIHLAPCKPLCWCQGAYWLMRWNSVRSLAGRQTHWRVCVHLFSQTFTRIHTIAKVNAYAARAYALSFTRRNKHRLTHIHVRTLFKVFN